ncbi:hypothetical protein GEMRC1_003141 [Eukaryota sp. GEM-RC1]
MPNCHKRIFLFCPCPVFSKRLEEQQRVIQNSLSVWVFYWYLSSLPFQGRITELSDTNVLWVPQNSRAMEEHNLYRSTFTQTVEYNNQNFTIVAPLMNSIIQADFTTISSTVISEYVAVHEAVLLQDLKTCVTEMVKTYDIPSLSESQILSIINEAIISHPSLRSLLGSPSYSHDGSLESASALSIRFFTLPVEDAEQFEDDLYKELQSLTLTTKIYRLFGNSFESEAGRAFSGDLLLLIGGIVLCGINYTRVKLPLISLLIPFLAYSTGRGILGLFNFETGHVNRFIPFLLLAISADDVFIIFNTRKRLLQRKLSDIPVRTLKKAGTAIFLTTATNVLAILSASTSSLFSLRSFGIEGSVCITVLFCLQILIIVPLINHDKTERSKLIEVSQLEVPHPNKRLRVILIVCVFSAVLLSSYGASQMEQVLEQTEFTPPDSYIRDYFKILTKHFPSSSGHLVLDMESLHQWSDIKTAAHGVGISFTSSWVDAYPSSIDPIDLDELGQWLSGPGQRFSNDVIFDDDSSFLSRMSIQFQPLGKPLEQIELVDLFREAFDVFDGRIFVYSPSLPFIEQFRVLFTEAAQTLSLALAAIFVVSWIVIGKFTMALFCFSGVLVILVNVLGVLALFSIPFTSIVVTGLCLCSGISVDYFIHVCESFAVSNGGEEYKARKAVWLLRKAIVSSAVSTFVSVLPLVFSSTSVFRVFCLMFLSTIILAFVYSLFVAPQFLPIVFRSKEFGDARLGSMMNILPLDNESELVSSEKVEEEMEEKEEDLDEDEVVEENLNDDDDEVEAFSDDTSDRSSGKPEQVELVHDESDC